MMMSMIRLTGHKDAVTCVSLKGSTLVSGSRWVGDDDNDYIDNAADDDDGNDDY